MPKVSAEHKFLYHYTDFGGVKGIIGSQTLWATHYESLNDYTEVIHMKPFLEKSIQPIIKDIMLKKKRESLKYARFLDRNGGLLRCCAGEAQGIMQVLYDATFKGRKGGDLGPFADPYVLSFCTHTAHSEYTKENGLLSMWRSYGNDGGFALVIDTERFEDLMEAEPQFYGYVGFHLSDAIYDDDEEKAEAEFNDLRRILERLVHARAEGNGAEGKIAGELFQPFFQAVTRFKHRGFKEECEVRLVCAPVSQALYDRTAATATPEERAMLKPVKPIQSREKRGHKTPYIAINDIPKQRTLPITRVIIGPQEDQLRRAKEITEIIGNRPIKVTCSETPFMPR